MRSLLFFGILWFVADFLFNLSSLLLPEPKGVITSMVKEISSGSFIWNCGATGFRLLLGLTIGGFSGFILGLICGTSSLIRCLIVPAIEFMRGIPTSMLFPIIISLFGFGELSKSIIVVYSTMPIIAISCLAGFLKNPETQTRRDFLTVNAGLISRKLKISVLIWDGLPSIISGFKISVSIGLVLVIVTEMFFVSSSGAGWAAHQAYLAFDLNTMYFYVLVVGYIGLGINSLFDRCLIIVNRIIGIGSK